MVKLALRVRKCEITNLLLDGSCKLAVEGKFDDDLSDSSKLTVLSASGSLSGHSGDNLTNWVP